jgi:hypothetical protein
MIAILVLGYGLMLAAPLLRRNKMRSLVLAAGAATIVALALIGIAHPNLRNGQAAIESDRRFYLLFLACELPVFALALISLRNLRWAFWLGWAINLALVLYLTVIVIWLEFFWHW